VNFLHTALLNLSVLTVQDYTKHIFYCKVKISTKPLHMSAVGKGWTRMPETILTVQLVS